VKVGFGSKVFVIAEPPRPTNQLLQSIR